MSSGEENDDQKPQLTPSQAAMVKLAEAAHPTPQTYRGYLGELVRDAGKGKLTVWMLAWRCKRCGHCWPVRGSQRARAERMMRARLEGLDSWKKPANSKGRPEVEQVERGNWMPRKCPGCDSLVWWKDRIAR